MELAFEHALRLLWLMLNLSLDPVRNYGPSQATSYNDLLDSDLAQFLHHLHANFGNELFNHDENVYYSYNLTLIIILFFWLLLTPLTKTGSSTASTAASPTVKASTVTSTDGLFVQTTTTFAPAFLRTATRYVLLARTRTRSVPFGSIGSETVAIRPTRLKTISISFNIPKLRNSRRALTYS